MYQPDHGVTFRVRCRNNTCKGYREMHLVKMPRQGDVVIWGRCLCVRCLAEMEVVSKELSAMTAEDEVQLPSTAQDEKPAVEKPRPPRPPARK